MSWWHESDSDELEPWEITNHVDDFFEYDHSVGRLRWKSDHESLALLPSSLKRNAQPGKMVGSCSKSRGYEVKLQGERRSALPIVWRLCTGHANRRIMTIKPDETVFRIDNLCVIPTDRQRTPKDRAKSRIVVSWSNERNLYTVVDVDHDYNKVVLSYHVDIKSAFEALSDPIVSFL